MAQEEFEQRITPYDNAKYYYRIVPSTLSTPSLRLLIYPKAAAYLRVCATITEGVSRFDATYKFHIGSDAPSRCYTASSCACI
mmetsp:Transcript_29552/g.48764  ORF Transcript_29552/g.48764 Transcript_29552/m.48764 type:complete len:83 (-) Transcript_29552:492-740(-)